MPGKATADRLCRGRQGVIGCATGASVRQGEYPLWEAILWDAILWDAILWDAILWDAIWLKASLAMLQGRVFCPESPFASRLAPTGR